MHYMLSILILPQHTTGPPLVRPTTAGEPSSTESMTQPTMSQRSNTVDNHATTDPSLLPTRITSDFSSVEPAIPAYVIYVFDSSAIIFLPSQGALVHWIAAD